ncbi:MAG: TIM-barrel domain-containing protein [Bacteroidota bacterium]
MNYMQLGREEVRRKMSPQIVQRWEKEGNKLYLYCPETILEISIVTDTILRFRFSPEGRFDDDFSYAVREDLPSEEVSYQVKVVGDQYHLITKEIICKVTKTLKITIVDKEGRLINEDEHGFHWEPYKEKGGNIVYCSKRIQEQENFYGMGDKPRELNLRGMRLENWGSDTYGFEKQRDPLYKNIPFYLGLHHGMAYGIFLDNTFRTNFDFGHERGDVCSFWAPGGEMNYYFIYGPELTKVSERYAYLTGTPELPPLWALGYQQSKWSYYPESKVKEIAGEMRARKIPCDVMNIDIDYMDGFRCFTWDKEKFPDPKRMIEELAEDGFKTIVIIDPGIKKDKDYFVYQEGIENGYFCRRADGPLMEGEVWPGMCYFPDFTNPEVRKWWAGLYEEFMASGIHGVWNDMNEPAVFGIGTFPDDTRHDFDGHPCSHRKAHNVYGMQMARATYEGVKEAVYPRRPVVLTRSGYAGVQRYSAVWTGDNIATWEHLWIANMQCQRLSISGVSFCGSDIGGFIGDPSGELYLRWVQMAVFHPYFRTHSSGDHGEQEPWSFGPEITDLVREAIELRYKLLPYIYTVFWKYTTKGTPMLLPLVYFDQDNKETYYRMDEFGMGQDLIMCPVIGEGESSRQMYLPKGHWYNYWTNEPQKGREEFTVETPINQTPIFVRAGAVLPHYPVQQYVGEIKMEQLTLHAYYHHKETHSELYEDSGDFYDHHQGNFMIREFIQKSSKKEFKLKQKSDGRYNSEYNEYELVIHGLPFTAAGYEIDGEVHMLTQNPDEPALTIVINKNFGELKVKPLGGFN